MRVRNLELRAKLIMEGFMSGLHRSPFHGFSVEFTDYREYSPGDDLRYLDWKLLARRDRQYIKRFEDETNLRCILMMDLSQSMSFGSAGYSKFEYARTLAASLAWFLNRQRDAVGLMTFGERVEDVIPPRYRTGHLRRLMVALDRATSGKQTNLTLPLEQIAKTVHKRSLVLLVSDLLTDLNHLQTSLGYLRARGHDVAVLRVLDRQEVDFDFSRASMFRDLESGKQIYVDPQAIAGDYQQEFQAHAEQLSKICQSLGVDLFRVMTDEPVEDALLALVQSRQLAMGLGVRNQQRRAGASG